MGVLDDNRSQIVNGGLISASFVSDLYDVLTGNTLQDVSISGSLNITGSLIGNLTGTADTASYVETAQTASYVLNAISASYSLTAVTASYALNAVSSSYAETASYSIVTLIDSSSLADSSSYASTAVTASYALTASYIINSVSYTEVSINSTQIASMGTSPITLLPAAGVNSYYDDVKISLEYNHNTTGYTIVSQLAVYGTNQTYAILEETLITAGEDRVVTFTGVQPTDIATVPFLYNESKNANITLSTVTSGNPIGGDGNILAKIWYKIKTFGTEL